MKLRLLLICLSALLVIPGLRGQDLRDPQFMARAEAAFQEIFNMDYDSAERTFLALGREYPHHPGPPLYSASIHWLREMQRRQDLDLNRFLTPTYFSKQTDQVMPAREREDFFQKIQQSEDLSKAILQNKSRDKDARYFLATAYGLRSSFAVTVDHKLREAFSYGNKTYNMTKQIIRDDPAYYDAYLALGTYEYIIGSIPWYMRWMVYVIGGHGSKQDGFNHLRLAAEKGQYVRDQAQLVLMVLYVRESNYAEGLKMARELNRRFPRSFLFEINHAQTLRLAGRKQEATSLFLQTEKRVEMKNPNFDKVPPARFRFNLGVELLYMGKLDLAQERLVKALDDPQTSPREKALSHLHLARILQWKRQPGEARKECQTVLSLQEFDDSHSQAKKIINDLSSR